MKAVLPLLPMVPRTSKLETSGSRKRKRRARARSRYGTILRSDAQILVTILFPHRLTLGLKHRTKEAHQRARRILRRADPLSLKKRRDGVDATFLLSAEKAVSVTLKQLDAEFDALARQLLHPALVEELLGITGRERIKWTRDGRLRRSGGHSFSIGNRSIGYALYNPAEIGRLARAPEVITEWRQADATDNAHN